MSERSVFIAFPNFPELIGSTISAFAVKGAQKWPGRAIKPWTEMEVCGRFIATEVLSSIDECEVFIADISVLNFNVTYEIGYAIARRKSLGLIRQVSLESSLQDIRDLGLFDTIGWENYASSDHLIQILEARISDKSMSFDDQRIRTKTPIYYLDSKYKIDQVALTKSRISKTGFPHIIFDPEETNRLSAFEAISDVAGSAGVVTTLLHGDEKEAKLHNLRTAFVAGLCAGMGKEHLILQFGDGPVPIDYRDFVTIGKYPDQIISAIAELAPKISAVVFNSTPPLPSDATLLEQVDIGPFAAENEDLMLADYYLKTDAFQRALRGDVQIVLGRKGSGKTALSMQVLETLRSDREQVVADLRPDGYRMQRFREDVLEHLQQGTAEHTVTAFWEYVLLIEIAHQILDQDRRFHLRDHTLLEPYRRLAQAVEVFGNNDDGGFSERLQSLVDRIRLRFRSDYPGKSDVRLDTPAVTELLFSHDIGPLKRELRSYAGRKTAIWVLVDNVDKGWPSIGINNIDITVVRSLVAAATKTERLLSTKEVPCRTMILLRNDVYELVVKSTPDRGKDSKAILDWSDASALRELLRRRLTASVIPRETSFEQAWLSFVESHVGGEESSNFVIERCLMRPRELIKAFIYIRGVAINRSHSRIEEDDIKEGLSQHSRALLSELSLEMRETSSITEDAVYLFQGFKRRFHKQVLFMKYIDMAISEGDWEPLTDLFLWYGILGVVQSDERVRFIYSVSYDIRLLKGLIKGRDLDEIQYELNPAFLLGLEIE